MIDSQRIDKWLYFTRFAKTRATAQEMIVGGHVAVNDEKVLKCSRDIKIGDEVEILFAAGSLKFRVLLIKETVKKEEAATLYQVIAHE